VLFVPKYFATCARGLEPVLAEELRALQAKDVEPGRGGVAFAGDLPLLYRANLYLRTAIRVLQPILEAEVRSPEDLYQVIHDFDWDRYLTPDHTIAVDSNVRDSEITHSKYAALRVKDGICDRFRERHGRRPSVDLEKPMVGLNLHIHANRMVLSLDSSGDSLHKRGYRPVQTRAPMNEALAAGLLLMTGWRGDSPLVDPLCGSGTLCIEGAWIALNRPPGLTRKWFGFMGWMNHNMSQWTRVRNQARAEVHKTLPHPILGSDIRCDAVNFANDNARSAGIGHLVKFERYDVADFFVPSGPPGVLICNPPYGERLGEDEDLRPLYRTLGEVFARSPGWRCFVFTGNSSLAKQIGMKPVRREFLFNGSIDCQFLEFHP
jgi:putative N6-adenine-specific DNA methylase